MKLSMFYRNYLRGADLAGKSCQVEILTCKQVTVRPSPQSPDVVKWCLWVKGLPADLPNGVLLGSAGAQQLREIFGDVDSEQLTGKRVELYPQAMKVAGVQKVAIRFRKVQAPAPAAASAPARPNGGPKQTPPPPEECPF